MKWILYALIFLFYTPVLRSSELLKPWTPLFYAVERGYRYPLSGVHAYVPYWVKKEPFVLKVKERKEKKREALITSGTKAAHMILAAKSALEMSWDLSWANQGLRFGLKFSRPFNVVFDHKEWDSKVEDTAPVLSRDVDPTQLPLPPLLLGLRMDF